MRIALMLRFLTGGLVLQATAAGLCYLLMKYDADEQMLIALALLDILILVWTAFRSVAAARKYNLAAMKTLQEEHAKEREKIRVNAERQKIRLLNKNHQQLLKETRRGRAVVSFKTGAVLAGLALSGIIIYSQFMTVGLLLLTAGGSGAAGYLARMKQEKTARNREGGVPDITMLSAKKTNKQLK